MRQRYKFYSCSEHDVVENDEDSRELVERLGRDSRVETSLQLRTWDS
jgi:hypothetical protein